MEVEEVFFTCPYCWESISVLVDPSVAEQTYTEDCENCCHPFEVSYKIENDAVVEFETTKIQ